MVRWTALAWITLLAACSTPAPQPDTALPEAPPAASAVPAAAETAAPALDCRGPFTPPVGWKQETVVLPEGAGDVEQVQAQARDQLVDKTCAGAQGCCEALRSRVSPWKTGSNHGKVCAMEVVKTADLQAWRKECTSITGLDGEMLRAAQQLLGGAAASKVAVEKVVDDGVPGGRRAEWLRAQMVVALGQAGATVLEVPAGWKGEGLPRGIDLFVRGTATPRAEAQRQVVSVAWQARRKRGRNVEILAAEAVVFPAAAAPAGGDPFSGLPPRRDDLYLHLNAPNAGSLCPGQETKLTVYTDKGRYVRVFNVFGAGQAILVWPPEDNPDGEVPRSADLFDFVAEGSGDGAGEAFVVIGADSLEGLGHFASFSGQCRVRGEHARALFQGRGVPPGALVSSEGFRIFAGPDCGAAPASNAGDIDQYLSQLPECK